MKKVNRVLTGTIMLAASGVFGIIETAYFGSNWLPKTPQELVCDIISAMGMASGLTLAFIGAYDMPHKH